MISLSDLDGIVLNGGMVLAVGGAKIGSVEQIFLAADSGEPAFVTVRTGLFGMSESFVPLAGASLVNQSIRVRYSKKLVAKGPRIESERGSITTDEEQEIYRYFGLDGVTPDDDGVTSADDDGATVPREGSRDAAGAATADPGADAVHPPPPEGHPPAGPSHRPPPPPPPHLRKHVPGHPGTPRPAGVPPVHPPGPPPPHPPGPPPAFRGHDIWPPPH